MFNIFRVASELKSDSPEFLLYTKENWTDPVICAQFGCGHHLTPQIQLFSNYCIDHQPAKRLPDPADKLLDYDDATPAMEEMDPKGGTPISQIAKRLYHPADSCNIEEKQAVNSFQAV